MTRARDLADSADKDIAGTLTLDAVNASGVVTGLTVEATGDTAAGDNAAMGYTAAEGLILTGQGSTNDVTIKNDADADVIEIPTGTVNVTMAGTLGVTGVVTANAGVVVDNFTLDGTTLTLSSGVFGIVNNDIRFKTSGDETMLRAVADGSVELMHDNATKLSTEADGIDVTGYIDYGPSSGNIGKIGSDSNNIYISASSNAGEVIFRNNVGSTDAPHASGTNKFVIGDNDIRTPTSGTSNVRLGTNAGNSIASGGDFNVCVGDEAGTAISTGHLHTFIGYGAGDAVTTDETGLTAVGANALTSNTSGTDNLAIGVSALEDCTEGIGNIAVGRYAAADIVDADGNVAIGAFDGTVQPAMRLNTKSHDNVAIGSGALAAHNLTDNSSGGNVGVGYSAGLQVTSAIAGTFIGFQAGANVTTGNTNTFVGASCGVGDPSNKLTGANNTALGQGAAQNLEGAGNGNTCIGRDSGTAITTGVSNVTLGYLNQVSSATVSAEIVIGPGVTGSGGSTVTIGSGAGKISNTFTSNATWSQSSDERLKINIQDDTLGLSFINRLNPVTYKWKPSPEIDKSLPYYKETNERNTDVTMHGLVAQQVKTALDAEGVDTFAGWGEGLDGVQTISREMFVSPLIKSIQELSTKLDAALARIATLEG
jgi:hypothetical protein